MKIAHVISTFPPYKGGMGNSAYHFARVLAERGHEVTVFTVDYGRPPAENENYRFRLVRLKSSVKIGNAAVLPQLLWELKGFDVIHLHYPFYGAAMFVLLKKMFAGRRMRLVVHYHMDTVGTGLKGMIFEFNRLLVMPWAMKAADSVVCSSIDYIKHADLSRYYGGNAGKFKQIPFGVELEKFRMAHGIDRPKTVLFVGGLDSAHYFKGLNVLLKAFKEIKDKIGDIRLRVIGSGDRKGYYENLARELGIEDSVEFLGRVEDGELADYYRSCYALALPSINRSEAFGMVLLEAMASGKPVVVTNLPGVRSVFQNGREGYIVKPGDASSLAYKLLHLLENEDLALRMGEAARKLVEEKYTWEKAGEELDMLYHKIKYSPEK